MTAETAVTGGSDLSGGSAWETRPPVGGDVVQLDPERVGNPAFAGCFMAVTELRSWGAQGYVSVPGGGQAYYRAKFSEMTAPIGKAVFIVP